MFAEIVSWNPINTEYINPQASLYIKPTLDILKLFNRAVDHKVLVRIQDSKSCYDNKDIFAVIDKSADVPNCRQNFFDCTGLYVVTLSFPWYGYPEENGKIEFLEGVVDTIINYVDNKDENDKKDMKESDIVTNPVKSTDEKNTEKKGFGKAILIAIVVSIFAIFLFAMLKRKK